MVFFLGSFASPFITPLVARNEGARKDSSRILSLSFIATFILSLVGFIAFGIFGHLTTPILFGDKVIPLAPYLIPVSFAMLCFSLSRVFTEYYLVKKYYTFSFVIFLLACAQLIALSKIHTSITSFVFIMTAIWISHLILTFILHLFSGHVKILENNIADLAGLFSRLKKTDEKVDGRLRILILNWRDTKHKWAGGAESYLHELAKRWVKGGSSVTVFCGNDGNNSRNEHIDGVNIVRRGGFYTVYFWAFLYCIFKFRNKFDLIIDSENGIPFFAPLYTRKPVLLLIHHIHQEVFRQQLRFPLSFIAGFLEAKVMTRIYRNNKVITVSESSKKDILRIGLSRKSDISIVNPGIDTSLFKKQEESDAPLFVYIGRLMPYKNVDIAIKAFAQVVRSYPQAVFIVIGEGSSLNSLRKLSLKLDLKKSVIFTGRVNNSTKAKLLARSWAAIQPSMVEGWGITVIEANAAGTPVIASNVSGLRDSVIHGQTGTLVPVGNVDAFATAMIDFILDQKYRKTLSANAYAWSQDFDWDKSARQFLSVVEDALKQTKPGAGGFQTAIGQVMSIFL